MIWCWRLSVGRLVVTQCVRQWSSLDSIIFIFRCWTPTCIHTWTRRIFLCCSFYSPISMHSIVRDRRPPTQIALCRTFSVGLLHLLHLHTRTHILMGRVSQSKLPEPPIRRKLVYCIWTDFFKRSPSGGRSMLSPACSIRHQFGSEFCRTGSCQTFVVGSSIAIILQSQQQRLLPAATIRRHVMQLPIRLLC
jgi:hypothetical protein